MRRTLKLTMLAAALLGAGAAQATLLSDLLAGGSITAGDKTFDHWSQAFYLDFDGRGFDPRNIDVTGVADNGDGPGLHFNILNGQFDVNAVQGPNLVDLALDFMVTPTAGHIVGASMAITDASATGTADPNSDSNAGVGKSIGTAQGATDIVGGGFLVELGVLAGVPTNTLSNTIAFAPQGSIWVEDTLTAYASVAGDSASLTGFTQRFKEESTQQAPEPATLALVGLGMAAAFARRRRAA